MRLFSYLYEDAIKRGLDVDEPEVGSEYSPEYVKSNISTIKTALAQAKKEKFSDEEVKSTVVSDLMDKLNKWQNVEKETAAPPPPKKKEDGGEKAEQDQDAVDADKEAAADANDERDKEREEDQKEKEKDQEEREEERDKDQDERRKENEEDRKKKKNESRLIKSIIRRRTK